MSSYVMLGVRANSFGLVVDFSKKRAIVRANTRWIEGVALENIPDGPNGYAPGMVLIHRDWRYLYFMAERADWNDDDYFSEANNLLKENKISEP